LNVARCGVITLVAVVLAGCGGGKSDATKRRDAVNAYFDRVDRAEAGLIASQGQIDQAFAKFRLRGNTATEVHELTFARDRVASASQRVRAIAPPIEARRLHADLVKLLALQHAAAAELLHVVTYQPQFERAVAPLAGVGKRLASDIKSAAKESTAAPLSASEKAGAAVWANAGCGTCHTLAAAGSAGTKGPDLDVLRLSTTEIAAKVRSGGGGMPAFGKRLAPAEIDALAAFVSSAEARAAANTAALDAYAAAFRRYHDSLDGIARALGRLSPPALLRPTLEAELRTLGRAATLSGSVSAALTRRDVPAANSAIRELFATAAAAGRASTQRAAAAAVRAYNDRLRRIADLAARITRERQRLVQRVG
jgi:mono/diheme cytochrome c family protein